MNTDNTGSLDSPVGSSKDAGCDASPSPTAIPGSTKPRDAELVTRLEHCLDELVRDDRFSGSVLVARDDITVFQYVCGLASKSYLVPNQMHTRFNIASVGKMFTGIAMAQLAERGELAFDDSVDQYLSAEWLRPEISQKIQIQHLLTHTSGLGDYFHTIYKRPAQVYYITLDDYKPLIADGELEFEPGSRWAYSNTGMLLLGAIIERITGGSYFDYVRDHIYVPAGMMDTDAYETHRPVPNRAIGYTQDPFSKDPGWVNTLVKPILKGSPSGGSYSTAGDMLRFANALGSHRLLTPQTTQTVLTAKPEIASPFYGYGFFVEEGPAGRVARHSGDGRGVNAHFSMYLDQGYTVIVLSNYDPPGANIVNQVCCEHLGAPIIR